ncbi:MAG: sulfotransferase family protein [Proteobacteria bacterium]|nr:sulfotransferase family protein [Pseudomonadota bacterium]
MTTPICLWSGPRNISTALMYSFAQRQDVQVVDEPLYGHYLRVTGANHPGGDEVLKTMNCDGNIVMRELLARQASISPQRLFLKHMAHHLVDLELDFLQHTCNIFLLRDPQEMLPSLNIQLPNAKLADTGLKQQWKLFSDLRSTGQRPVILDAQELLLDPRAVLQKLCEHIGLDFDARMLHWQAGPKTEDGVWAPHWYQSVHESTGFTRYKRKSRFPDHLKELLNVCRPWYEKLYEHALRAETEGEK